MADVSGAVAVRKEDLDILVAACTSYLPAHPSPEVTGAFARLLTAWEGAPAYAVPAVPDPVAAERERIRQLAIAHGALCICQCGTGTGEGERPAHSRVFADLLAAPRPSPAELWERSGGNRDLYVKLLREHRHVLGPGDEGYDPDAPQVPPCGWGPS